MKRYACGLLVGLSGMILSGCPIFPNEIECYDNFDCPSGYYCNANNVCVKPPGTGGSGGGTAGSGGTLSNPGCSSPGDCGPNETCGQDGTCHPGDCYFSGCVDGYECVLDGYQYVCVPTGQGGSGGGTGGTGGTGATGGSSGQAGTGGTGTGGVAGSAGAGGDPVYCGNPSDCPPGQVCSSEGLCVDGTCEDHGCENGYLCEGAECVPENSASCILDADCSPLGAGYKCVNGMCTAPADQCTDKTQCPDPASQSCVDGKCVASCHGNSDCPEGYTCDTTLGVCTVPATGCTVTQDCGDPEKVCVAGACVDKCGPSDACPEGYVCVANGCVPDQKPVFTCSQEGVQDVCSTGSICLHHSCYIACTPDPDSCAVNPPDLNQCKPVTTSTGSYQVCGSSTNLGDECDPTAGAGCSAGKICIDGFCR